jgi:hypothetical protein
MAATGLEHCRKQLEQRRDHPRELQREIDKIDPRGTKEPFAGR